MRYSRVHVTLVGVGALALSSAVGAQGAPFPSAGVDSVLAKFNHTDRPGCALGVYRNGQTVYARGYGMAELNQRIPITPDTKFYIASTSKQFAAASLQLLAMQGTVSLDDPVRKYIPELPAYADAIKLHHLMHHTSGIRDYLGLWAMSGESVANELPEEKALASIVRQQALDFAPGSRWSYSNSGYFLISLVVKRASGKSLAQFAHDNIFEPLGMRDTHFHDDNQMIVPRRAEGYEPDGKGGFRIVRTSFALVGDGGLYTTVNDLAKWDENFYHNKLAGGEQFVERMYSRATLNSGDTTNYASGLMRNTYRGLPEVDHGGAFIGYRAELLRFPTEHTSISILCNDYTVGSEALAKSVANVVLADKLGSVSMAANAAGSAVPNASIPTTILDRYVGRFEFLPGAAATVARDGGSLTIEALGQRATLTPVSDSSFVSDKLPGTFTFARLGDGRFGLKASAVGLDVPSPPLAPAPTLTPAQREAMVGRYVSEELGATYVVKDDGGQLRVRPGYSEWLTLTPFAPNAFSVAAGKVVIDQQKGGRVTAFHFDAGRMRNLKFVRVN